MPAAQDGPAVPEVPAHPRGALPRLVAAVLCGLTIAGCDEASEAASERWIAKRSSPLERTEVAAARSGARTVVVAGGYLRSRASTRIAQTYDVRRNRWRRIAPMPVALNHAAAVSYRGSAYVFGGFQGDDQSRPSDRLMRYDARADRWRVVSRAPSGRGAHAVGVIGDRLYAAGGTRGDGRAIADLAVYDFGTGRWSTGPPMTRAREHLGGAVAGGRFYAIAGRTARAGAYTEVEAFSPRSGRWEDVPDLWVRRAGIGAATVGARIVVAGGELSTGTVREVEVLDVRARSPRWRLLPPMRTPRHGLGVVAAGRRVLTLQGGPRPGYHFSGAVEALRLPPR